MVVRLFFAVALVVVLCMNTGRATADLVISSEVVFASAGAPVAIDFFATDPNGLAEITSVNIPIDVSFGPADGDQFPNLLTFSSNANVFITNEFGTASFTSFSDLGFFDFDLVINVVQPPSILVGTTETLLFSLNFDVAAGAAQGDIFNLTFDDNPIQFQVNGSNIGGVVLSPAGGQIVIDAIPEPGSSCLVVLLAVTLLRRNRRLT